MANLIDASSTETRVPKVVVRRQTRQANGRLKNPNSLVPAHQARTREHRPCVYTQNFRAVPGNLFEGAARYTGRIESGAFHRANAGGIIRIEVTMATAKACAPVWAWFDRITFRSSGGSSHVTTAYSDSLAMMLNEYSDEQLASILPLANATATWGQTADLGVGSHVFFLPLSKSFMEGMYFDDLAGDVLVDLFPMPGGAISSAGGGPAGTVVCNSISFLALSDCVSAKDAAATKALHGGNIMSHIFLEPTRIETNSVQLTAGQERKFELDNVTGNVAFLQVCVRPAGATNENNDHFNYVTLANPQIDLKTAAGRSAFGEGVPVDDALVRDLIWARQVGNNFLAQNACVVIPCCDSIRAALSGVRSGGSRQYRGDRETISIVPGAAFSSGTYQVTVYAYVFKSLHKHNGNLIVENA